MRTYLPAMQTHLDGGVTTLTTCVRVERLDGAVLTVTAFNRSLTIDGEVYLAHGFLRSDVTAQDGMDTGTTEITGVLDAASITEDDLRAGRWDFAAYTLFQVNWADLTMGRITLSTGNLGVVRTGRIKFVAELLSLMQAVQNSIGSLNTPLCTAELGDARCGVVLGPYINGGIIDSVDSDFYGIHDSARTEADGYYSNGIMEITSGVMTGMRFEVRAYIQHFWVLFTALPYDATHETYTITRGCDKSLATCRDVFDNVLNRRASDYTQGGDAAVQVGRHNG